GAREDPPGGPRVAGFHGSDYNATRNGQATEPTRPETAPPGREARGAGHRPVQGVGGGDAAAPRGPLLVAGGGAPRALPAGARGDPARDRRRTSGAGEAQGTEKEEVVKRAAIYARMSTDKQSADSPADQIACCRAYAQRHGLRVVLVEEDAGISGASRH